MACLCEKQFKELTAGDTVLIKENGNIVEAVKLEHRENCHYNLVSKQSGKLYIMNDEAFVITENR